MNKFHFTSFLWYIQGTGKEKINIILPRKKGVCIDVKGLLCIEEFELKEAIFSFAKQRQIVIIKIATLPVGSIELVLTSTFKNTNFFKKYTYKITSTLTNLCHYSNLILGVKQRLLPPHISKGISSLKRKSIQFC